MAGEESRALVQSLEAAGNTVSVTENGLYMAVAVKVCSNCS